MLAEFGNTNCEVKFKDEKPTKKYIIIVEAVTSNSGLKKHCQKVISKYRSLSPCLCYLSIMKGYDTDEMQALIDKRRKRKRKKIEKNRKFQHPRRR